MKRANGNKVSQSASSQRLIGIVAKVVMALALISAGGAMAATCTSLSAGRWDQVARWDCGHIPLAADTVVIAHNSVQMRGNYTVAGLTVNAGALLDGNNNNLTVNGAVTISGTYNTNGGNLTTTGGGALTINTGGTFDFSGGNAAINGNVVIDGTLSSGGDAMQMTGANTTLSGTGNVVNTTIEIDATGVSVPVGANLKFDANSQIDVAANVSPASLTINGTIDGTAQAVGDRIIRVSTGGTLTVGSTGVINAPNSRLDVRDGASATNNGTITIYDLRGRAGAPTPVFTQGVNSTLNIGGTVCTAACVLNASAAGNTVNYTGAAQTVYVPSGSTYANLTLSGSGATTVPTGLTITGNFTMSGTATVAAPATLAVGGNFTIGAGNTFAPGTGTVTLNGTAAQTIGGANPVSFNNLTVTNATSPNVTLATNVTVTGTLTGTVTLASTCPSDYMLTSNGGATVQHSCPGPTVNSINTASPNPTTSGAAVSWTVSFGTSVTGVTATNFALVQAGGVTGATITSVTGAGATWTVNANAGGGAGTLGLNMVNVTGINPALTTAMPFVGQVYSVSPPAPVAYYHDTTNGVNIGFDGPTNVISGTNVTIPPVITASLNTANTCPVANNARSSNHPVGLYTHSRWYLTANYAVATNISANPAGRMYVRGQTIADTVIVSLYDYDSVTGTKLLIGSSPAITISGTLAPYPYTISSSLYTVPAGHRLMLEYNFNQSAGGDRARVYCSPTDAFIAVTETPVLLDHLVIQSSGSGLTCAANTLTIVACQDAACATLYTGGVSGTLSASGPPPTVNWDGTTGGAAGSGFVIPAGLSGVTKNVQVATAGSATFGIATVAPAPANLATCNFGNNAPTNNNCVYTASTAGFIFSDTATGTTYTIPAQVSGIASVALYLRALQAATTNPAVCTPAIISSTSSVNMGYVCNNPATCQAGSLATINATAIAPAGTAVSLTFDANGSAPITVRYDDAGQITLNASKTATPFGGATAITLNGSSNAFVVKPDHFDLSAIQRTSDNFANPGATSAADICGGTTTADCKFVKAGEQFSVTVTARNFANAATPNFGQETPAENVKLTPALVAGLGLTNNPAIVGTFSAFANGVATGTAFTWNEVGIITLTPSVLDASYLGAGDTIGTVSGNIGRFYAAQFTLTPSPIANRTGLAGCAAPAGCGTFTYMGEQMSAVFNLIAKAVDGTTTLQNYNWSATPANQFAKLDPTAAVTAGTGGPLGVGAVDSAATRTPFPPCAVAPAHPCLTPAPATAATFASGVANSVTVPLTIYRDSVAAAGPYAVLDIGVAPLDGDGAVMAAHDLDTVNVVAGAPNHTLVGQTQARYGRMKLSNAHGSELLPLPITATAQYWNGTTYVTNTLDNNSSFPAILGAAGVLDSNYQKNLVLGETSIVTPPASVVFFNGVASYKLAKPGAGNNGSVDMTVNALSAYLPSGNTARATFGVYKGANEFIYLRENY